MYKYDANIKHCFNKTIDLLYYFKALLYFRMILNNKGMETTVKERLMKYLYKKYIKSNYFCSKIGVSAAFISSMRKSIQPDKLHSIAVNIPDLSIEWLLTGEGNMLRKSYENVNKEDMELLSVVKKFQDQIEKKDEEISILKKRSEELEGKPSSKRGAV